MIAIIERVALPCKEHSTLSGNLWSAILIDSFLFLCYRSCDLFVGVFNRQPLALEQTFLPGNERAHVVWSTAVRVEYRKLTFLARPSPRWWRQSIEAMKINATLSAWQRRHRIFQNAASVSGRITSKRGGRRTRTVSHLKWMFATRLLAQLAVTINLFLATWPQVGRCMKCDILVVAVTCDLI